MEMAELENASPHEAEKWLISLRFTPNFKLFMCHRNQISLEQLLLILLIDTVAQSVLINNIKVQCGSNHCSIYNCQKFRFVQHG